MKILPLVDSKLIAAALKKATAELLRRRDPKGHWLGELSSSALSTATAVCALQIVRQNRGERGEDPDIIRGLQWLANHSNADGGWGDTTQSLSNPSTTTLCWAAFGAVPGSHAKFEKTVAAAEQWIRQNIGGTEPSVFAPAIIRRYGKDRTFSIPILTMCALAGRLGNGPEAWHHVKQLPFELAACPHQLFATLRLPVVSYALPALIAIGQARHHHRPSKNPALRIIRNATRHRTLAVLEKIQPTNGGFLEATPLTSFVTMSLAGSGLVDHPVCRKGAEFLRRSQREDGSWPIDTNLCTWLTTLAVDALGPGVATLDSRDNIRDWLLGQQYQQEHPYTHAAAGGWAWTDLPGGVPDTDDTSGALLALRQLDAPDAATRHAALMGATWLLGLQNSDGGIPTFCRGWGALPFDRSSADITAHAIRAWLAWADEFDGAVKSRVLSAANRAVTFLKKVQKSDGSWVPLWFGNQHAPNEENPTYGTARVVPALVAYCERLAAPDIRETLSRAAQYLLNSQNPDGSWSGFPRGPASIEETALALDTLATVASSKLRLERDELTARIALATNWLIQRVEQDQWTQPAPIGFYFARLWYYEKLYPLVFSVGALTRVRHFFA